jgi:hypothetical protein
MLAQKEEYYNNGDSLNFSYYNFHRRAILQQSVALILRIGFTLGLKIAGTPSTESQLDQH